MTRQPTTTRNALRRGVAASAAAVLLLALGACGSEDASEGDDANASADGFDVNSATLTDEPFCDEVDTAMVAEVLGMQPEQVKTQVDRAVDEEFEGPNEEGKPPKSVANLCVFGSSTSQFIVSVQPEATADDVQQAIDELASLSGKGSSETCEPTDASAFGDPSGAFTCESKGLDRQRIVVTGLVGDSKFYCAATVNQGAGAELAEATAEACRATMEQLASA
jgi:hypothetical protein